MKPIEERLGLDAARIEQLRAYESLLLELNRRHNLVSRESATDFWERHIRHSLALAARAFPPGCTVVDWGSGGGLPGVPLAILFPEVLFTTIDSVGKKVRAVEVVVRRLGLENVKPWHGRAEEWGGEAHYAVSRATARLVDLWGWTGQVLRPFETPAGAWEQGLLALKGGDLTGEMADLHGDDPEAVVTTYDLDALLGDTSFAEKVLVHVSPGSL